MKYVAELVRFTPRNDDIKHCETLTVKDKKTTVLKSIFYKTVSDLKCKITTWF